MFLIEGFSIVRLWIVRHGHCGTTSPDSELTPLGEQQAHQIAQRLINVGITAVLSSPLVRALGTACIITKALGNIPVEVWPEIREGFSWQYQATSRAVLQQRFPLATFPPDFALDGWDYGNDTYESFLARSQQALQRLITSFPDEEAQVVMVTHGGFANYLLHSILCIPSTNPQWFEMDYCAVSCVSFVSKEEQEYWPLYPPVDARILSLNDCSHLSPNKLE